MTSSLLFGAPCGGSSPPLFRAAPIQQAHDARAELHQCGNLRARQPDHLFVPAARALDEIEHLAQAARGDRTDLVIALGRRQAFA